MAENIKPDPKMLELLSGENSSQEDICFTIEYDSEIMSGPFKTLGEAKDKLGIIRKETWLYGNKDYYIGTRSRGWAKHH